jgi:hypothetical protein
MNNYLGSLFEKVVSEWPQVLEITHRVGLDELNWTATIPELDTLSDSIEEKFLDDDNEYFLLTINHILACSAQKVLVTSSRFRVSDIDASVVMHFFECAINRRLEDEPHSEEAKEDAIKIAEYYRLKNLHAK